MNGVGYLAALARELGREGASRNKNVPGYFSFGFGFNVIDL
jgi:hypothetical protein